MFSYSPENATNKLHHSAHLHGHGFAVISVGYKPQDGDEDRNNPDIVCESTLCSAASWNKSRDVYVTQSKAIIF